MPSSDRYTFVPIPHSGCESLPGFCGAFPAEEAQGAAWRQPGAGPAAGAVFAFVRNPWERAAAVVARLRLEGHPEFADCSWREGLLKLAADDEQEGGGYDVASQMTCLCDLRGQPAVQWVGRRERMAEDAAEICARLGLPSVELGWEPGDALPDYRSLYDEETREAIARRYAADVAVLGYGFDGLRAGESAGLLEGDELRRRWKSWLEHCGVSLLGWRSGTLPLPEMETEDLHRNYEGLKLWGWYLDDAAQWMAHFRTEQPVRALEIGAFDGVSANVMLDTLFIHPQSELHTVDPFLPDPTTPELGPETRRQFETNHVRGGHGSRLVLHEGLSVEVLAWMTATEGFWESFDFIYVDGSHIAKDVFIDAALSWNLLKPGGVLAFDDYNWGDPAFPHRRPRPAIDSFERVFGDRVALLFEGSRRFYRKLRA